MEEENEDLFDRKDLRKKKEKKRTHKQTNSRNEKDDYAKESIKKMRDELLELRKKEADRAKEFEELKRKIEEQEKRQEKKQSDDDILPDYVLEFNKELYLNKGFIESAKWIKDVVAKNMSDKMVSEKNKTRFEALITVKKRSCYLGVRACARFNRGELCHSGKWHTTHRPDGLWTRHGPAGRQEVEGSSAEQQGRADHQSRKNELRLHACTLCLEALGAAYGHTVLDCPWILKKNWNE